MEVTRKSVLAEALKYRRTNVILFSERGMGLRARKGMEDQFDRYVEECRILRELIQALDNDKVRAAIAEFLEEKEKDGPDVAPAIAEGLAMGLRPWQLRVLKGGKQEGLFEDGHKAVNVPDHPEGRGIPGGTGDIQRGTEMERQPMGRVEDADPGEGAEYQG